MSLIEGPVSEYERVKEWRWSHGLEPSNASITRGVKRCARTPWVSAPEGAEITPAKD